MTRTTIAILCACTLACVTHIDGDEGFGQPTAGATADPDLTDGPVELTTGAAPGSTGLAETSAAASSEAGTTTLPATSSDDGSAVDSTTSTTGGDPPPACCGSAAAAGCSDAAIETCVCAADPYCCSGAWDIGCVVEIEDEACGACGSDDEVATCEALCTTFVTCAPQLGYADVDTCMQQECLGLLDMAQAEGQTCLDAIARYNACIGLLDCAGFDQYLSQQPAGAFPCAGFQTTLFDTCPFATM